MTQDRTDAALVRGCADGDARAWGAIIDRFAPLILSIARRSGLKADEGDEILQTVLVILLREIGRLRDGATLPKWIITTTKRECWRHVRRERRRREAQAALPDPKADEPPELSDERLEREQAVRTALGRLSPRCRDLLRALVASSGATDYRTLSERLGMPIGSVGPIRARCLERLRAELQESGDWPLLELAARKKAPAPVSGSPGGASSPP